MSYGETGAEEHRLLIRLPFFSNIFKKKERGRSRTTINVKGNFAFCENKNLNL